MRCAVLVAAVCAGAAAAQVRVLTALPEPVVATLRDAVGRRLPGVEVRWQRRPTRELWDAAVHGRGLDADVLAGVDAQVADRLAVRDRLADLGVALPEGAVPFHVEAAGRYVVPWADAWVLARDPRWVGDGRAPRTLAAMADPAYADRLVLPEPAAAPSLFVEWLRQPLRTGVPADEVFAELVAVDARLRAWAPSAEAVLEALAARPDATFAVLPLTWVRAAVPPLSFETLEPFTPLRGLAVAVCGDAADATAARAVVGALLDPALALRLAALHGVLPGIGEPDPAAEPVPAFVRELVARAAPVVPERRYLDAWLTRFDDDVRGRGRYSEGLQLVLDLGFGLLFLVAMYWIYRRSQVAEG